MKTEVVVKVSDLFPYPGGRHREDGPQSGQAFREDVLLPKLQEADRVILDLDGVAGLPSSFLDEAFGGLVRLDKYSADDLSRRLVFRAATPRMKIYPEIIQSKLRGEPDLYLSRP